MDYTDGTMKFTVINNKSGGYSRVQYLHSLARFLGVIQ